MSDPIPPRPDLPPGPGMTPPPAHPEESAGGPRATWRWWEALLVFLLGLFAGGLASLPIVALIDAKGVALIAGSIVSEIVWAGVVVLWLRRYHPGWRHVIRAPDRFWPELGRGMVRGLAIYAIAAFGIGALLTALFGAVSGAPVRPPRQLPGHMAAPGVGLSVAYGLGVAPFVEEFLFRGVLFGAFRARYGFPVAALGSAIFFGLIHFVPGPPAGSLLLMTTMVFTGLGLAYVYERRGNLVATIGAHIAFNLLGLALIFVVS